MPRFDRHALGRFEDGQRRVRRQQGSQHASAARVGMLDEDEGHAGSWRPCLDQLGRGFQPTGGRADTNDGYFGRLGCVARGRTKRLRWREERLRHGDLPVEASLQPIAPRGGDGTLNLRSQNRVLGSIGL